MKKILVSCLLLIPAWGIAQEPTEQEIRKAATNYMVLFAEGSSGNITKIHPDMQQKGTPAYQREALIHVLEFRGGGWIIMSNDYRVQPVLAYSPHGTWNPDTSQMPSGLIGLLSHYMAEINLTKSRKPSGSSEEKLFWLQNSEKWKGLQDANSVYLKSLIQSKAQSVDNLLNQGSRGSVAWGQSCNASKIFITPQGDYAPRYNKFAPARDEFVWGCIGARSECDSTDNKHIGCGAVAMGQILWYWQFPPQYDWDRMPSQLTRYSSTQEENNIAHLLKTCGDNAGTVYCCSGSWTTANKINDALKNMNFPSTEKIKRGDRDKGSWWPDLIKYQLDQGQPVLYRGDKCDLCTLKHFWVISGYDADGKFYCNWGWNGSHNGNFALNDLTPYIDEKDHYRKNNRMLYHIIPDWDVTSSCTLSGITKGNNEELRSFCGTATLNNITLTGNSQSKIAFTQELIINGPLTVSGGATLTLACYDKERSAYLQSAKSKSEKGLESGQKGENVPETVQTEDLNASDELSELFVLSPNPARNEVRIALSSYDFGIDKKDVMIFDSRGHLRYQAQFSESTCTIPLSRFETGLYFVRVICGEFMDTQKLIVQ